MRTFQPLQVPADFDPRLVNILKDVSEFLTQTSAGFRRIERGEAPVAGGAQFPLVDESKFVLLAGRPTGQIVLGSDSLTGVYGSTVLDLRAYNSTAAANLKLDSDYVYLESATCVIRHPSHTDTPASFAAGTGPGPGFQSFVALVISQGYMAISGAATSASPSAVLLVQHGNESLSALPTAVFQKRASQSSNLVEFRSGASPMSYIRATDGAFVGPIVGAAASVTTITGTTNLDANHVVVLCNAGGGGFSVNLPAASGITGRRYTIKKIDTSANVVTIDANGAELIDASTTIELYIPHTSVDLVCDGTGWRIT